MVWPMGIDAPVAQPLATQSIEKVTNAKLGDMVLSIGCFT